MVGRAFLWLRAIYFVVVVVEVEVTVDDVGEVAELLIVDDESLIMVDAESVAAVDETESLDIVAVFSVVLLVEQAVASVITDRAKKADLIIAFIIWGLFEGVRSPLYTVIA